MPLPRELEYAGLGVVRSNNVTAVTGCGSAAAAVVVTGAPSERALTARVTSGTAAVDLGGRTSLAGLDRIRTLVEWQALGVRLPSGEALPRSNVRASIILPDKV